MKKLMQKRGSKLAIRLGIFFSSLIVRMLYFWRLGIQPAGDTPYYLLVSQGLIEHNFSLLYLIGENIPFYFWLYPYILALFFNNQAAVIIFQIILQALASVLIFQIGKKLFNAKAGLISAVGYVFLWEIFQWDIYILTDSIFVFLLIAAFFFYLKTQERKSQNYANWTIFALSIILIFFLRPTSIPFLVSVFLILAIRWKDRYKMGIIVAGIAIVIYALFHFGFSEVQDPRGIGAFAQKYIDVYQKGEVISARPEYNVDVNWQPGITAGNVLIFIKIFTRKLVAYWEFIMPNYALGHKIVNIITFIPLYALGVYGFLKGIKVKDRRNPPLFILYLVVCFWIFHALTEIEPDGRYRLPLLAFLVILSGYGLSLILDKILARVNNIRKKNGEDR